MSRVQAPRVLVVEDDPNLVDVVVDTLVEMGCEVDVALRFEDVASCLVERAPHLTIVSLNLPRNSGYDVCELIRGDVHLAAVQILITSDRTSPAAIAYAEDAGANAFLRKPYTRAQLAKYVT